MELNTTGESVNATVGGEILAFTTENQKQFFAVGGTLLFGLTTSVGAITLDGTFGIQKSTTLVNGVSFTVITVSIKNATTSLTVGSGATGVKATLTNINGALLIKSSGVAGVTRRRA